MEQTVKLYDSSHPSFFLLRMILEESANENARSVINNVKMTARRRGLPDPLSMQRHGREINFGGLGLRLVQSFIILLTSLHLNAYSIHVSSPNISFLPFILEECKSSFFTLWKGNKHLGLQFLFLVDSLNVFNLCNILFPEAMLYPECN